jgi:hypothetical protein
MKHAKTSPLNLGDFEVPAGPDGQPAVIGRGSFGVVYRALDRRTGEEVALKVLNEHVSTDEKAVARFKEETREHKRLNHPGIVSIQDSGDFGNQLYYSMEYCRGGDLAAYSKSQGPLEPVHALKIIQQIADALVYASGHYLLHRDIKPGNILLVKPPLPGQIPKVKLTDFGLSKISVDLDSIRRPQMSLLGGFHGTLQYASPEQVMEDPLDVRSDIFSLGLTLWHLLVGAYPLGSQKEHELINDRIDDHPYRDRFPGDWPPALAALLGRMLEKKPEKRFRDFGELTRVLEDCIDALADTRGGREVAPAKGRAAPLKEYFTQIDRKKKRPLGVLHTARMLPTDGVGDPSPCHFLLLESGLDGATMEALRVVVESISANPHPNIAALDWQETLDGLALVIHSPPEAKSLLDTIRKEGKHALASVHQLLEQAASATDHARSLGIELNAHPRDVNLLFDFTGTRLLFTASLPGDDAHEAGPTGGTIAGTMMGEGPAASGDSALMDFATLLYWMVSARMPVGAAYVNPNAYKAIEGLGETGNCLIRDALCRRWNGGCLEFFTAICREEGLALPKIAGSQSTAPMPSVSRPFSSPEAPPSQSPGGSISTTKSVDLPAQPPSSQYPSRTGSLANSRAGGLFARQREQRQREIEEKQRQLEEERRRLEEEQAKAALMEDYLQEVEQDLAEQLEMERQQLEEAYKQQLREKEEETNRLREAAERVELEKAAMMEAYLKDVEKDLAEQLDLERQHLEVTFQQQLRAKEEETNRLREAAQRAEQERLEALRLAEQKEAERLAALESARSAIPLSSDDSESLRSAREEAIRLRQEAEAERVKAAEKLRLAEEEAARKAEEAKRLAEEAAAEARRKAESEAAEARRLAEEEARKVREAAEAERKAAAEQLRKAHEEAERKAAEAKRKAEEEAAARLRKAEEEAERKAAEAKRKAEEEAAARLRKAEEEAERKAAEAKRKAELAAAEAKRKAEAEARALREEAAREKELAKKEAEKIRAAAREGKSKPFLPLPALLGLASVLVVGGFFALRPLFQGPETVKIDPPPPPPPPPVVENGNTENGGGTPVVLPPAPPAPKTWYSTWKLAGTVGEDVQIVEPGGEIELRRDNRIAITLKHGQKPPSSIIFRDEAGEFPISVLPGEWTEQAGQSAGEKQAPWNIELNVEASNLPEMAKEFGSCALVLADRKGMPSYQIPLSGKGRIERRLRPGEYGLALTFEDLLFNDSPKLALVSLHESTEVDRAPGAVPCSLDVKEGAATSFNLKVPDLLETREIELITKTRYQLVCVDSANQPYKFGDDELVLEFDVDLEKLLVVGCAGRGEKKFSAEIRNKRPDDLDLVEAAETSLRKRISPGRQDGSLKFAEDYSGTKENFEKAMKELNFAEAKAMAEDLLLMELEMFRSGMDQVWKNKGKTATVTPHDIQLDPRDGVLHYSVKARSSDGQGNDGLIRLWKEGAGKYKVFDPEPSAILIPGLDNIDDNSGRRIYMARLAPSEKKRKTEIYEIRKTRPIPARQQ